jgi:hypothetical protein
MHSAGERSRSDPAKVLNGTANSRIFGNGEMHVCVVVVYDIRCGLNSSPYRLATVSRLMAKINSSGNRSSHIRPPNQIIHSSVDEVFTTDTDLAHTKRQKPSKNTVGFDASGCTETLRQRRRQ